MIALYTFIPLYCPSCGTPMITKTSPRLFGKPHVKFICANAPDCKETFPG